MRYIISFLFISLYANSSIYIHTKDFTIKKDVKSWIEFKNENLVRQEYDYSCGSATLATMLKYYYGLDVSEKSVLDDILISKGIDPESKQTLEDSQMSLSFLDLAEFSTKKGFKTFGVALDFEAMKELKIPVILFVKIRDNEHFTVYKYMDDNNVYLADPSFGNIKVSIAKFKEMFFQIDDLKYPGKILAIIPDKIQNYSIDTHFLDVKKHTDFVYEVLRNKSTK